MFSKIFSPRATKQNAPAHPPRLGYLPALDGLRALAVLAVLFYHADVLWLPGGFLGVEIFFVISGYLITSLLLAEYRANQSINLKQFWQRRARRLLPALFAMILAVLVYAVIFLPEEVASLRADVLAAFVYVTNWYLIVAEQSYFEVMGRPSLLRHLWSLAVEEQFYLLWPLIFAFLLTRLKSRAAMLVLMAGALISALWMGIQFYPDTDPSRIYYGTDTRAAGLLLGAALAFVALPREIKSNARKWLLDGVGVLALGALIVACLALSEFDPFLYQGGMLVVGALTALVIAAAAAPQSPWFASLLGFGVLRWIGLRSYSLYLWHWPIFMVTRPQLDTPLEGAPLLVLRFALTFALAEISYRVVELPIRNGALGSVWDVWKNAHGARRWGLSFAGTGLMAAVAVGTFFLGSAVLHAQPPQEPEYVLMVPEEQEFFEAEEVATTPEHEPNQSADLSPVSYVILDEEAPPLPAPQTSFVNPPESERGAAIAPREPLKNEILSEAEQWRLRRAEITRIAKITRVNCDDACELRAEYAQMKEGVIRATTPIARAPLPKPTGLPLPPQKIVVTQNAQLPKRIGPAPILAIGDSVMLGATHYFRKAGLDVDVDAKVGRQVSAAINLLRQHQAANTLAPIVVIHLGNNGTFTAKQLDEMMEVLRDVPRVIFLTTKVPRKWQEPNNTALVEGVQKYPNAHLVDWNGASNQHAEWFWKDGIHLRPEGAHVYAHLIAEVIYQTNQ